tara:strand:+ start:821 stop:1165 length:345 start_codon:yes stop_codon:yes gene_type:complete
MKVEFLEKLYNIIEERKNAASENSYVKSLFSGGVTKINEKVLEESLELLEATLDESEEKREKVIHETADLWFHTIVLLSNEGIDIKEVIKELESRFGKSGILEKASREVSKEEK